MGQRLLRLTDALRLRSVVSPCRVHSEHDWQEQSDAPIIVSHFPFRGDEFCNSAPRNGKSYNRASPAGRFPGFIIMAPFIFKGVRHRCRQAAYILAAEPPPQPSALKGLSSLRTFGAKAPSILRTLLSSEPSYLREYRCPPP